MTAFLRSYALVLSLGFAVLIVCLFGSSLISENTMPFGDGQYYASRAFALYGYLHSGQWDKFWDLFTSPKQTVAPLHYWIFFLIPQAWAGVASYLALQLVTTYLLLGFSIWKLCSILERQEWAPAIFLLCAIQTFSLDYAYSFFMDMPFCAMGVLALAWQIQAWKETRSFRKSVLSGLGVALLFWIKPANATLFLATYVLAEIIHLVILARADRKAAVLCSIGHLKGVLIGFIPMLSLALACGAGQTILLLINNNEVNEHGYRLASTGLLRLLYFPLCLTYYYHTITLILIFGILIGVTKTIKELRSGVTIENFPLYLLIPVACAYLVLGEFFSFGMYIKTMRSLVILLPVAWLLAFYCLEKLRVSSAVLLLASFLYVVVGFSQIFFDSFGLSPTITEDYQLEGNWLSHFPITWDSHQIKATQALNGEMAGSVKQFLPQGGKVCVNSKKFYFNGDSLYWRIEHEDLLKGIPSKYQITTIFNDNGEHFPTALAKANMIVLISCPNFQTDEATFEKTDLLLKYSMNQWRIKDHKAKISLLPMYPEMPLGYEVIFNEPLDDLAIKKAMQAIGSPEANPLELEPNIYELKGHHYSLKDVWMLLWQWKVKRFG